MALDCIVWLIRMFPGFFLHSPDRNGGGLITHTWSPHLSLAKLIPVPFFKTCHKQSLSLCSLDVTEPGLENQSSSKLLISNTHSTLYLLLKLPDLGIGQYFIAARGNLCIVAAMTGCLAISDLSLSTDCRSQSRYMVKRADTMPWGQFERISGLPFPCILQI